MEQGKEKELVLNAWKERWSDDRWMEVLIDTRKTTDPDKLSNAVLDLLTVGNKPNEKLLHYLELAIACQALPICSFIHATNCRIKAESLHTINSIVTTLGNHMSNMREEADADNASKLPTSIMTLVEWLVYIQVNAIKQLSFGTEEQCLSLFRGCSKIISIVSEDVLLKSLAPLWGGSKWQTLTSATHNIQIPLDACSDEGKKILASSLVTFVRCLEKIHDSNTVPTPPIHLFNLPCKLLLYHDILYGGNCGVECFNRVAQHYGCSLQKVCAEWGVVHLQVMVENKSLRELVLAMLLYKFPRIVSEMFPNVRQSEPIIVALMQQEIAWSTIAQNTEWNIMIPFLQTAQRCNLISRETYDKLSGGKSCEQTSHSAVSSLKNAEQTLSHVAELFGGTNYSHTTSKQIVSLLEGVSATNNGFTEQFDKMFFVAAAKGELADLMNRICGVIESTCDGASSDPSEEQDRFAVFDISCLILVRSCMMFGANVVSSSFPFCRWLGSHVCMDNPLHPLMPLLHPIHPPNHKETVDMLVKFFSSDGPLNLTSLQNVIIAFPDALKDIMLGIKSEVIIDESFFDQQTAKMRDYLLTPVFVAIHWLIHWFSDHIVSVEDDHRHMTKVLMKPFLKHMSTYNSTVLLTQRVEILQKNLNATLALDIFKIKKTVSKKPFWVAPPDRSVKLDAMWSEVRINPTLDNLAKLFTSDNVADIVYSAATQTLGLRLSDDIKHAVFTSAVFLQSNPRYVPWLLQHTIPDLLNDGLPSHWKSYIWALAQLAFLSLDLYMGTIASEKDHAVKRQCRGRELESPDRSSLLREALAVFWSEMRDVTIEEGYSYPTSFLHRFIKYGIDLSPSRLKDMIADVDREVIKTIATHLIEHELVSEGVTLLQLSGSDQNHCSAILQTVL